MCGIIPAPSSSWSLWIDAKRNPADFWLIGDFYVCSGFVWAWKRKKKKQLQIQIQIQIQIRLQIQIQKYKQKTGSGVESIPFSPNQSL